LPKGDLRTPNMTSAVTMDSHQVAPAIPIVEEQVHVERETAETGGVRVRVQAARRTEVIDEPVIHRGLRVERVERNQVVESRREPWYEDQVMVVPVYEEVIVKQLVLKEELRLTPTADGRNYRTRARQASPGVLSSQGLPPRRGIQPPRVKERYSCNRP
jgi:stress response protein YsnF